MAGVPEDPSGLTVLASVAPIQNLETMNIMPFRRTSALSRLGWIPLLTVFLVLPGCVSTGEGGSLAQTQPITRDEIRVTGVASAYDLLIRVRPTWLRTGGGALVLYLDQTRVAQGSAVRPYLERFSVGHIREMRWLPPEEAREMPNVPPGNLRGAIQIITTGE